MESRPMQRTADVMVKRVPVAFRDNFVPQQRLFYPGAVPSLVSVAFAYFSFLLPFPIHVTFHSRSSSPL